MTFLKNFFSSLDRVLGVSLFFGFLGLYIHTCGGTIPPYRDTGEMALLIETLGVAHPPGYPLYGILGRLFSWIPLGNMVYRINLFSCFCGAGALVFLYYTLRRWVEPLPALFACVVFGLSNPTWELANVTEMYALGVLWVALLLFSAFRLHSASLTAFLMAIGLGARMDMMLLIPIFVIWFFVVHKVRQWHGVLIWFVLGLTVFLYMPIRSLQDPVLDWANPESLSTLFNSLSRKSYASTLDLLSLNYEKGENFGVNVSLYVTHISRFFGWWSWIFIGWGVVQSIRKHPGVAAFFGAAFVIVCPVFLFLANMPPNPHSIAIVEAAYPVPDMILAVFFGFGVAALMSHAPLKKVLAFGVPFLLVWNASAGYETASKRDNFFTRDYIENVFRSAPRNSVVVFHEDVQLFSLWHAQLSEGRRKDISLIATGLSASAWYWDMLKRWGTPTAPPVSLKTSEGWGRMKQLIGFRPLVVGQETQLDPTPEVQLEPRGLLVEVLLTDPPDLNDSARTLDELCVYRGSYIYGTTPDFFSSDLASDYSRSYLRWGLRELNKNNDDQADWYFQRSEHLDPTFARPTTNRGYLRYRQNKFKEALVFYESALFKHRKNLELVREYRSLPSLAKQVKKDLSDALVYAGATAEKTGDLNTCRAYYKEATEVFPNAQAHYNLAVTYWRKDWDRVVTHMQQAVTLDPTMALAQKYLLQAQYMRNQIRQ